MKLYKPITVDLYNTYPLPRMSAQQHNVGRGAIITLTANGQVIALGEETVRIFARRPDGNVSYLDCTITEDGKIQADFTDQMLAAEGNVQVELEFTTTETNITTPIFIVEVNKSNVKDGVKSSNEYKALEKYTEEAKEGGKAVYIGILIDSVTKEYGYKSDNFEKVKAAFEKGKTVVLHILDTNEYAYLQTATKDYFKFILFGKNDINAFQIFHLYSNGLIANYFINIPVLYEWALQEHSPTYTYSDVGADKDGAARDAVNAHNISAQAHSDIRVLVQQLQDRINTVANSDDVSLDQLAEVVEYIKDNRELIAQVTSNKVNVSDIIDNLITSDATRPLSAKQGVALNTRISEEVQTLRELINAISDGGSEGDAPIISVVQADWNESTETSDAFIKNKPPIKKGEFEDSLQGTSSIAIGNNSIAFGKNSISGCKGYYIKSIDSQNKKIYLSNTKVLPIISTIDNTDTNFDTPAYEVGDSFCIINSSHYILKSSIISITNNVVTYDTYLGFSEIEEDTDVDGHTFFVPTKPEVGVVSIADYANTEGLSGIAAGKYSHVEGRGNLAAGAYAHVEGNHSVGGYVGHAEGFKTKALGDYSHSEGEATVASNKRAHAEGYKTNASGEKSHAEGNESKALGPATHAEGIRTQAKISGSHTEGMQTTALGENSHAEGKSTNIAPDTITTSSTNNDIITAYNSHKFSLAKGNNSHVEGLDNLALGKHSHVEGFYNKAIGIATHAEGNRTRATGNNSHTEGYDTQATSVQAHAEGESTIASGSNSHAEGSNTIASGRAQHVQGRYNITDYNSKYAHIIGNGTSDNNRSNAHTVDWQGNGWYKGSVTSNGADYAEYFEWQDGNPDNEDRVGLLVSLDGEKIKLASVGDEMLGIISGTAAVLGDNYECEWKCKYITDDFGRIRYEEVEEFYDEIVGVDEETNQPITEKKSLGFFKHPKLNPNYDPEQKYINRADRPEWSAVGMLGKLYVRDDGTCDVNGYVTVGENGIATTSATKTNMRVLTRVSENVIRVLLK